MSLRDDRYPLGERGEYPVRLVRADARDIARSIPGAHARGTALSCTWDLAACLDPQSIVAALADPRSVVKLQHPTDYAGIERFSALKIGAKLRPYQREGVAFLAARAYALCCDEMRLGKTVEAIAAAVLTGADRVVVIPPASVRLQWASEIQTWTGDRALLLYGRAGTEARWWPSRKLVIDIDAALIEARWIVVNPDILIPQSRTDAAGRSYIDPELCGWGPILTRHKIDLAIIDEIHRMRGWRSKSEAASKAEVVRRLLDPVRVVWGLTGTPIMAHVRDLWLQLQLVAKCWGEKPFTFHARYCGGGHRQIDTGNGGSVRAWYDAGESNLGELVARLRWIRIQRSQHDVIADLPLKTRTVRWLDANTMRGELARSNDLKSRLYRALAKLAPVKIEACLETVVEELEHGSRVIVFAKMERTAALFRDALAKHAAKSAAGAALRARDLRTWIVTGETTPNAETRYTLGAEFRRHTGAACWIGTIDACAEGLDLSGAMSVYFLEVAHEPYKVRQAEMRAFLPGATRGLAIYYYGVRDSVDESWISKLVPRLEKLDAIAGDRDGIDLANTLRGELAEISAAEILADLTAHIEGEKYDMENGK